MKTTLSCCWSPAVADNDLYDNHCLCLLYGKDKNEEFYFETLFANLSMTQKISVNGASASICSSKSVIAPNAGVSVVASYEPIGEPDASGVYSQYKATLENQYIGHVDIEGTRYNAMLSGTLYRCIDGDMDVVGGSYIDVGRGFYYELSTNDIRIQLERA